ncbi:MBL fold metallo-hydrolase [Halogeometricum luteum]|uniref:MBL fold metallo-hydrolase n=1 Tax=Halogeometricum luteum TaxID=2950537 RepID=A0ABU2FZK5_9EURY|nr:MBL fold metallo-hydrolase [Halogeometricum sp. S3BR5-2]MDS0293960.1 MBL fold metallo-hydrolase [Halogeometricum sp. S3BR5-2]
MSQTLELPESEDADAENGSVFFVGTATVIIRYAGFTILTDPNFLHSGDHAHLGYGIRSERTTDPAIDIEDLPEDLDFVLLSHYHGDHFDHVVEEKLDKNLPIVTTEHAAEELEEKGFRETYAMDTWEEVTVRKGEVELDITSTPGRHGPPVVEKALPPVMGSVLEFRPTGGDGRTSFRLFISGDTVMYDELEEIPERFPDIDLALLHLGGTEILGVLLTMDAEQGVEAVELFDADENVPVHYDDYEVFQSPLSDFEEAVEAAGLEDRVAYVDRGDTYRFEASASTEEM